MCNCEVCKRSRKFRRIVNKAAQVLSPSELDFLDTVFSDLQNADEDRAWYKSEARDAIAACKANGIKLDKLIFVDNSKDVVGERVYRCNHCKRLFRTPSEAMNHLRCCKKRLASK